MIKKVTEVRLSHGAFRELQEALAQLCANYRVRIEVTRGADQCPCIVASLSETPGIEIENGDGS